uniref:Disease resistance R13L4/SHOC-2-like LRR domain-containing protein n=1 Tax=Salix viminalis TaxID=40686 RepID=A0A6N2MQQ4_SALVM
MGVSIRQDSPILNSLFNITSLRKLALRFSLASQNRLNDWISKQLTNLQSLRLRSIRSTGGRGSIKLTALQDHQKLMDLYLLGVLPRPVNIKQLPPNLKILTLSMSQLRKDPMRTLGQLPYLNILRLLADSYMGEELTCYQGGFPQLHVLKLWKLMELRELTVKEGAMPCVKQVEIRACRRLEKVEGLSKLTTLKELMLTDMPSQFANKVKENMGADVFVKENEWKSYPFLA